MDFINDTVGKVWVKNQIADAVVNGVPGPAGPPGPVGPTGIGLPGPVGIAGPNSVSTSTASTLTAGLVKTATGHLAQAVAGTDYLTPAGATSTYVPYTGANRTVDLGNQTLITTGNLAGTGISINGGGVLEFQDDPSETFTAGWGVGYLGDSAHPLYMTQTALLVGIDNNSFGGGYNYNAGDIWTPGTIHLNDANGGGGAATITTDSLSNLYLSAGSNQVTTDNNILDDGIGRMLINDSIDVNISGGTNASNFNTADSQSNTDMTVALQFANGGVPITRIYNVGFINGSSTGGAKIILGDGTHGGVLDFNNFMQAGTANGTDFFVSTKNASTFENRLTITGGAAASTINFLKSNTLFTPQADGTNTVTVRTAAGNKALQLGTFPSFSQYGGFWAGNITPSSTNYTFIGDGLTETIFNVPTGGHIQFRLNQVTPSKMTVNGTGVGIGNDSPTQALHVVANADNSSGMLVTTNTTWAAGKDVSVFLGDTGHYIKGVYSSNDIWFSFYGQTFQNNSGTTMVVGSNATSTVGIGVTSPTAYCDVAGSTTSQASLRIRAGTAPTSPNHGDGWTDANHLYFRLNGVTYQIDQPTTLSTIIKYNGISVAGTGLSPIVANSDQTGKTAAATVVTYTTPAAAGTYRIGGYLNITAVTLDVIQFQVAWTDEASNSRTQTFFPMGATNAALSSTGFTPFPASDIRVKASTTITVSTVLTTGTGTIAYDVGGSIMQIS